MSSNQTLQDQLFIAVKEVYQDAIAKKINENNYLDIHIPSVNASKGTHLFFNTAKNVFKIGFYCRDLDFVSKVVNQTDFLETFSNGLRPIGNIALSNKVEAVEKAVHLLRIIQSKKINIELSKINDNQEEKIESKLVDSNTNVNITKQKVTKQKSIKKSSENKNQEFNNLK